MSWWVREFVGLWIFQFVSWCVWELLVFREIIRRWFDLFCTSCLRKVFILCWHHRENKRLLMDRNIKSQDDFSFWVFKLMSFWVSRFLSWWVDEFLSWWVFKLMSSWFFELIVLWVCKLISPWVLELVCFWGCELKGWCIWELLGFRVYKLGSWFVLHFVYEKGVYLVLASQREQTPLNV